MDGSLRPTSASDDGMADEYESLLRRTLAAAGPAAGVRPGPAVLIVDDDQDVPLILQRALARRGYSTVVAATGHTALLLARSIRPAAIVSELYLCTEDGPCFVHAVRRDPLLSELPLVAYTAFVLPDDESWAASAPVDVFVRKPALPSEVVAVIERLAGRPYRVPHA